MMKKSLVIALAALSSYGALTSGCIALDMPDSVSLSADIRDAFGKPLSVYFDYYLDLYFYDGTIISYYNRDAASDLYGKWNYESSNLALYTTNGSTRCYDTCVAYDDYGCYKYATDCYNNTYSYSLNVADIRTAAATIGIDSGFSYVSIPSSKNVASQAISSMTYKQSDIFVTPFLSLSGPRPLSAGLTTQSMASTKNSGVAFVTNAQLKAVKNFEGKMIEGVKVRDSKPARITDLTQLSAEEMSRVIAARKTLHIAPASSK